MSASTSTEYPCAACQLVTHTRRRHARSAPAASIGSPCLHCDCWFDGHDCCACDAPACPHGDGSDEADELVEAES